MNISKLTPEAQQFRNQLRAELGIEPNKSADNYSPKQPRQLTPAELMNYRNELRAALGKGPVLITQNIPEPPQATAQELLSYRNKLRDAIGNGSISDAENPAFVGPESEVQRFRNELRDRVEKHC